jgi:redox-sensitive bicupin YhaK (pirin superfamily)
VTGGNGQFGSKQIDASNLQYILFDNDGSQVEVANVGDTVLDMVLLAGRPFKEPVAHQGLNM